MRHLGWKCGGVAASGLRATVGVSMSPCGGLLEHLSAVEDQIVQIKLLGRELGPPWDSGLGHRT